MEQQKFRKYIQEIRKASIDTLLERNFGENGYAKDNEDAIHNFTVGAEFLANYCGTPAQAAWDYMVKHVVSLRDKVINSDFERIADVRENCRDIINYTSIIYAIACDENETLEEFRQNFSEILVK